MTPTITLPTKRQRIHGGNQNGTFTLQHRFLLPFAVEAAVQSLPVFCASAGMASVIDTLLEFMTQEGYQFIVRGCPTTLQQGGSNVVLANQTYEDQISVPTGSFLTMVGGISLKQTDPSNINNPFNVLSTNFRTRWYDAGAQAAISDGYMHANNCSGNFIPTQGQPMLTRVGGNKNLFILPSPMSITSPGQLNVQFTNLESVAASIEMAFFFAAPLVSDTQVQNAVIGNVVGR